MVKDNVQSVQVVLIVLRILLIQSNVRLVHTAQLVRVYVLFAKLVIFAQYALNFK